MKNGLESNSLVADRFLGTFGANSGGRNRLNTKIVERQSLVQHINMCFRSHDDDNAFRYLLSLSSLVFSVLKELNQKPPVVVSTNVLRKVGYLFVIGYPCSYLLDDGFETLSPQFFKVHDLPLLEWLKRGIVPVLKNDSEANFTLPRRSKVVTSPSRDLLMVGPHSLLPFRQFRLKLRAQTMHKWEWRMLY